MFDSEYKNELSDENGMGIIAHMLKFGKTTNFKKISDFPIISGKIPEKFWKSGCKLNGNHAQYVEFGQSNNFQRISMFPENIWKSSRKMLKFDIVSAKSISVTKIKWKWCPIHWNWPNIANSGKFPDFQKISRKFPEKNPEKFEIWYSECKINFSDWNQVEMMPHT